MLKKVIKYVRNIRQINEDMKLNRKLIGTDKYENRYYQYFDNNGYEAKRGVEYKNGLIEQDFDINWENWLRGRQKTPYTQDELNTLYKAEDEYKEAAFDYEKRDSDMMSQYRKEQAAKHKEEHPQTGEAKGQGEEFEPGSWNPGVHKNKK